MKKRVYLKDQDDLVKATNKGFIKSKLKKKVTTILSEIKNLREDLSEIRSHSLSECRYLKNEDVKELLNVSTSTLSSLRANGVLPYYRVNRTIYFRYDELIQAMNNYRLQHNY